MVMNVLFVCTGNTCRSSMAEGLARALASEMGLKNIYFSSAGTLAWPGEGASPHAVQVLADQGIEIAAHRATLLTPELIAGADLVLTMTASHRQRVLQVMPESQDKVFTLGTFAGLPGDILDPYGGSEENYRCCAKELAILIRMALEKIKKQASQEDK